MPARVVDGEGLWRSKKLKKVPVRYRAEYANLLPLAHANGVFDCDPESIFSDVYSFNRTDIALTDVHSILFHLEQSGLLRRWSTDGRIWGYWTGIGKSGRLPTGKHLDRYKNLPPDPPPEVFIDQKPDPGLIPDNSGTGPGESVRDPAWIGMDWYGLDRSGLEQDEEEEMKAAKQIPIICQMILGTRADMTVENVERIKVLESLHKGSSVINVFTDWARLHKDDELRYPIRVFLVEAAELLSIGGSSCVSPQVSSDLKELTREITYLSDNKVSFNDKQRARLGEVLSEGYTPVEVIVAFKGFYAPIQDNDYSIRNAAKDFSQGASDLCYGVRRNAQKSEETEEQVEAARVRTLQTAELEHLEWEEKRRIEEEAMEDTLGD